MALDVFFSINAILWVANVSRSLIIELKKKLSREVAMIE
jgi:hypothetical protein